MGRDRNKVVYLAEHKGDKGKLLEKTFREHGDALRRFLQVRLALEADQEDMIQELFLRLARVEDLAERLSAESGNTRYYLFSILTNLIIDMQRYSARRKQDQHDSLDDDVMPTRQPTPESIAASQQEMDKAMQLLKRMNPKYREAFVLNRFKYKSYREISIEMGVSTTTVERYIAAALSRLRKGLK